MKKIRETVVIDPTLPSGDMEKSLTRQHCDNLLDLYMETVSEIFCTHCRQSNEDGKKHECNKCK
jgi:hypothetical protein